MATENTRPTTLAGVKRLAKFIKQEQDIPYHDALDGAARKAGFQNFRHAQSVLGASACDQHRVFLTFYWGKHDRSAGSISGPVVRSGRTTFEFLLPVPLKDLLPGKSLERTPYLNGFRLEAPDHLELRGDFYDKNEGVRMAEMAALALNFMAATGLRAPLESEMYRPYLNLSKHPDHSSHWYDEESKCEVVLDEPYRPMSQDEIDWAKDHGFYTVGVPWRGIYLAGYTPRLHAVSEAVLSRLVGKLVALEAWLKDQKWTHNSDSYQSQFISPARVLSGKRKPPRIMPTPQGVERAGAVPCGDGMPGHRSLWRPARRMDLNKHLHIGPIMSSLWVSMSWNWTRIGPIRSTLDAWFRNEYEETDLPKKELRRIYDLPKPALISGTANQLTALADVRQTIVEGYQNCKPKRELLEEIDKVERWIRRTQAKQNAKATIRRPEGAA